MGYVRLVPFLCAPGKGSSNKCTITSFQGMEPSLNAVGSLTELARGYRRGNVGMYVSFIVGRASRRRR